MAGTSLPLVCSGFIETDSYRKSKGHLRQYFELSDEQIDDRLNALMFSIHRDPSANTQQVRDLNLWVAVTPRGIPPLRIFLRPRPDVPTECELLWIEERL